MDDQDLWGDGTSKSKRINPKWRSYVDEQRNPKYVLPDLTPEQQKAMGVYHKEKKNQDLTPDPNLFDGSESNLNIKGWEVVPGSGGRKWRRAGKKNETPTEKEKRLKRKGSGAFFYDTTDKTKAEIEQEILYNKQGGQFKEIWGVERYLIRANIKKMERYRATILQEIKNLKAKQKEHQIKNPRTLGEDVFNIQNFGAPIERAETTLPGIERWIYWYKTQYQRIGSDRNYDDTPQSYLERHQHRLNSYGHSLKNSQTYKYIQEGGQNSDRMMGSVTQDELDRQYRKYYAGESVESYLDYLRGYKDGGQ